MEGRKLKCLKHDSEIIALCLEKDSPSLSVCAKCLLSTHKAYQSKVIFIEDILSEDLSSILTSDIFRNTITSNDIKHALKSITPDYYQQSCSALYSSFLDKMALVVSTAEEKTSEVLAQAKPIENFEEDIKKLICLDELKEVLAVSSDDTIEGRLAELSLVKDRSEIISSLRNYANEKESDLKFASSLSVLEKNLNDTLKLVERNLQKPIVLSSRSQFDSENTCVLLEMSEDKRSVKHIGENNNTLAGLLELEMSPNSGVYRWKVQVTGLESVSEYPSYWIGVGIVEEEYWGYEKSQFSYSQTISVCTDEHNYGGMNVEINATVKHYEGHVFELTYDSDNQTLTVEIEGLYKAFGKTLADRKYKPIVMTYRVGNTCTIVG